MTTNDQMSRISPTWLAQREAADAAARAADLVAAVRDGLAGAARLEIHDLGRGTGSVGRWLASQLPGPQHRVLHDREPDLPERAATEVPVTAAAGTPVTVEIGQGDVTAQTAVDLADADLVTAAALLDLLTAEDIDRIVAACAGIPALFTLSVTGRVALHPADPLDGAVAAAFNAHQRRTVAGRRLLGPDAVDALADAYARRGGATAARPSPWRLGRESAALVAEWFAGWLDAAADQEPELAGPAQAYARSRADDIAAGRLHALVDHADLLAAP
jgi:hypothetical protein